MKSLLPLLPMSTQKYDKISAQALIRTIISRNFRIGGLSEVPPDFLVAFTSPRVEFQGRLNTGGKLVSTILSYRSTIPHTAYNNY